MRIRVALLAAALACLALPAAPDAQIPGLDRFMNAPAVLTTGLSNVMHDVPLLDDDEELAADAMTALARDADGSFLLQPGTWETRVQSFCLLAGTVGPSHGDGYLYAPLVGPKAALIEDILTRTYSHPDIPQSDVQSLLWAILAHAKFSALSGALRRAAAQLLTVKEIAELQASALDRMSDAVREQLTSRMPPQIAAVFDAEAKLRDLFAEGASYSDLASVAVLDGTPEPQKGDREIPEGRWNYDPAGFFVRFQSEDYTRSTIQIMVPEAYTVSRDALHRITSITSADGWATETEYNDAIPPLVVPGDPGIKGYAFKRVTLRHPANGRVETLELPNAGWTFVGRANGKGRVPDGGDQPAPPLPLFSGPSAAGPGPEDPYADWGSRYKDAAKWQKDTAPPSQKDADNIADEKHYGKGVKAALGGDEQAKADWLGNHFKRLGRALAYAMCRLEGGCDPDAPKGPKKFNPAHGVEVPGAQGAQRKGHSALGAGG